MSTNFIGHCEILIYVDNNWHYARPCIDSVLEKTHAINYHITIINDASNQFVSNSIEEYVNLNQGLLSVLHNKTKLGNVRSINKAMKRSNAQFIAIVSSKAYVTINWLNKMLNCINSKSNIGICVPLTNNSNIVQIKIPPSMDIIQLNKLIEISSKKEYPTIPFAEPHVMVFSKNLLDKIGCFDEKFPDFETAVKDFSSRAKSNDFEIVCADDVFVFYSKSDMLEKRQDKTFENNHINTNSLNNKISGIVNDKFSMKYLKPKKAIKRVKHAFKNRWNKPSENNNVPIDSINSLNKEILSIVNDKFSMKHLKPKKTIKKSIALNILCILPTLNPYGGVISVINMLNHLIEMGHNCILISLSPCENHSHLFYGEPIYIANWEDIPEKFAGYHDVLLATSWDTVDIIVKIQNKSNYGHAYYFVQDLEETFYDEADIEKRQKVRATYEKTGIKFVKTNYLYKELKKITENVFKIRPGMNLDLFYPHNNEDNEEPVILGMVRYGHYHRGYDLVLETLNKVSLKRPNSKIILFGSTELDDLPVNFEYINYGRVKPENLPELYSKADIFLEMSRHHGFGRTGVEAMACNTACVLSDSGGINEYAVDCKNALIVPVGDTDTAAERICFLIDNPKKRKELTVEGLKTVSIFSDREAAKDFLDIVYKTHPLVKN